MKYIYNQENKEIIEKLKTYKLNKLDEKQLIDKFLKDNKLTALKCLLEEYEVDLDQKKFKKNYIKSIISIVLTLLVAVFIAIYSYNFITIGAIDGLETSEKIIFALLALLFHIVLLTIFILIFNIDIILKKNILNKLRNNLK